MIWMREVRGIYQIYIDQFFLIQLIFHICNLSLTSTLLKLPFTYKKISIVAFVAAVISSACLLLPFSLWRRLILGMLISVMVSFYITYKGYQYTGYGFLKILICAMGVSLFLGGFIAVIQKYFKKVGNSSFLVCGCVLGCTVCLQLLYRIFFVNKKTNLYRVILKNNGFQCEINAFLDTGNGLVEPISQKPVSLVEESIVDGLDAKKRGVRIIPYRAVGTKNGIIYGYEIDSITIVTEETKIMIQKPMIAVGNMIFHEKQEYQMLLHPRLIAIRTR